MTTPLGTFLLKKLLVPFTNERRAVDAVRLWEVRWTARTGRYSSDEEPVMECFTSQQDAIDFAESIRLAFKLLKYRYVCDVTIREAK